MTEDLGDDCKHVPSAEEMIRERDRRIMQEAIEKLSRETGRVLDDLHTTRKWTDKGKIIPVNVDSITKTWWGGMRKTTVQIEIAAYPLKELVSVQGSDSNEKMFDPLANVWLLSDGRYGIRNIINRFDAYTVDDLNIDRMHHILQAVEKLP